MWTILIFAIARADYDCSTHTAVKVALVLDKSGSTEGAHFRYQLKVANEIVTTLQNITKHLHVGVIAFNAEANVVSDMSRREIKFELLEGDFNLNGGATLYTPALKEAKKMLVGYNVTVDDTVTSVHEYIILLTDGAPDKSETEDKILELRNTIISGTDIVIASAFLTGNTVSGKKIRLLSCSDVNNATECNKHVIERKVDAGNMAKVQEDVSTLFGTLVEEKSCKVPEPSIIVETPVSTPSATNDVSKESDNSNNSGNAQEDDSYSLLFWLVIGLSILAGLMLLACVTYFVTKKMKTNKLPDAPTAFGTFPERIHTVHTRRRREMGRQRRHEDKGHGGRARR